MKLHYFQKIIFWIGPEDLNFLFVKSNIKSLGLGYSLVSFSVMFYDDNRGGWALEWGTHRRGTLNEILEDVWSHYGLKNGSESKIVSISGLHFIFPFQQGTSW